jgi:hypothetical protein
MNHRSHYRTTPKRSTELMRSLGLAIVIGVLLAAALTGGFKW